MTEGEGYLAPLPDRTMPDFVECGTVEAVIEAANRGGQSCFRIDNPIASGTPSDSPILQRQRIDASGAALGDDGAKQIAPLLQVPTQLRW